MYRGDTGKSGHGRGDFAVHVTPLASISKREREREREGGGENTWKEAAETNFQRNFVDSSARPDELSFGFTKLSFRRVIVSAVEPSDSSG